MKIELLSLEKSELRQLRSQFVQYPELVPVLRQASALFRQGAFRELVSGAWVFGPDPTRAPFAFRLVVFPALDAAQLSEYESKFNRNFPVEHRELLHCCNGLRSERITLFGAQDQQLQMNPHFTSAYVPFDAFDQHENNIRQGLGYANLHPLGTVLDAGGTRLPMLLDVSAGTVSVFQASGVPARVYPTVRAALAGELGHPNAA